jgi:hypothetical protein
VLGGSLIGEVAERYGTTRQSLDSWRKRSRPRACRAWWTRSSRLKSSPSRVETLICQLRLEHPRWGITKGRDQAADKQTTGASGACNRTLKAERTVPFVFLVEMIVWYAVFCDPAAGTMQRPTSEPVGPKTTLLRRRHVANAHHAQGKRALGRG